MSIKLRAFGLLVTIMLGLWAFLPHGLSAQGPIVGVPKVDLDGDALDDVLGLGAMDPFGRYSGAGGLFARYGANLANAVTWLSGSANTGPLSYHTFRAGNFDGDSTTDLLQIGLVDRVGRYTGVGSIRVRSGGLLSTPSFPVVTTIATNMTAWTNSRIDVGDFDGDGRSDLLIVAGVDIYGRYTGSGCITVRYGGLPLAQSATVACNVAAWNGYTFTVGDFDGDGSSDLLGIGVVDPYGRYTGSGGLFIRSGGVTLPTETVWSWSQPAWAGYTFQVGDFDGDGRSDLLGIGAVDIYGRYVGSGGLFVRRGGLSLPTETVWSWSQPAWAGYTFQVGDFDGDLRSDVLGIGGVDIYGRYTGGGGLFIRSGGPMLPTETVWARDVGAWAGYVFEVGDYLPDSGLKRSEVLGIGVVDVNGRYAGSGGLFVRSGGLSLPTETVWAYSTSAWTNYRFTRRPLNIDTTDAVYSIRLGFAPALVDLNGDDWQEPLGTYNDKAGWLFETGEWFHGIQDLFASGRFPRDNRVADFTGDGKLDILANTYNCANVGGSLAKFYKNNGDDTFTEVPLFMGYAFTGNGETIVAADFDNDGDLDAYMPVYTAGASCAAYADHSPLLVNDGTGRFQDFAVTTGNLGATAGVGGRSGYGFNRVPEGAHAADVNGDGWIDLYVAGHLYLNNKDLTFTRWSLLNGAVATAGAGALPFDEGMKFTDWNNDGILDVVIMEATGTPGPRLYECNASMTCVLRSSVWPSGYDYTGAFGLNAYDLDNDGREDIMLKGGTMTGSKVLLNSGTAYSLTTALMYNLGNGAAGMSLADIDRDGRIDIFYPSGGGVTQLRHIRNTLTPQGGSFSIEVLGPAGQRNQQGRVVRITGGVGTMTRVVDGGSGYMAQTQYPILVGTPATGAHTVSVFFAPRTWLGESTAYVSTFTITPGQRAKVFAPSPANPAGSVQILPALPPAP